MKPTEIKSDWTNWNNLSEQIQKLANYSLNQKEEWTTRTQFLFKQKERLQNIRDFATNKPVLEAYLVLQSYKYKESMSVAKLIERIGQEVEQTAQKIEKKATKLANSELTDEQLLIILGERIAKTEIRTNWESFMYLDADEIICNSLFIVNDEKEKILSVDLETGKITPDLAKKFLDKHNFKK